MSAENKITRRYMTMALSNIAGWNENTAGSACGASDKPAACGCLKSPLPVEPGTSRRRSSLPAVPPVVPETSPQRLLLPAALPTNRKKSLPLAEVPAVPATSKIDITKNIILLVCLRRESSGFTRPEDSFMRETADSRLS